MYQNPSISLIGSHFYRDLDAAEPRQTLIASRAELEDMQDTGSPVRRALKRYRHKWPRLTA